MTTNNTADERAKPSRTVVDAPLALSDAEARAALAKIKQWLDRGATIRRTAMGPVLVPNGDGTIFGGLTVSFPPSDAPSQTAAVAALLELVAAQQALCDARPRSPQVRAANVRLCLAWEDARAVISGAAQPDPMTLDQFFAEEAPDAGSTNRAC